MSQIHSNDQAIVDDLRLLFPNNRGVYAFGDGTIHIVHEGGAHVTISSADAHACRTPGELREMFDPRPKVIPPLVAGGQGRTGPDVIAAAGGFLGLIAILASAFLMGILAYQLVQLFAR